MALQLGALRKALIEAGASPDTADNAAEEVATYDREMADVRSDLKLLKWGQTLSIGIGVTILLRLFLHG
jgi:hypothetical protein